MKRFFRSHPYLVAIVFLFGVVALSQPVGRILNIDNLQLDGNTISTTNTNGDLELNANGTGETLLKDNVIVGDDGSSTQTIGGATVQNALDISNESSNDLGGLSIERHTNDDTFGAHILNLKSRGSFSSQTAVQNNDFLSRYVITGYDGTDYEIAAEIRGVVDGTVGSDDVPGSIEFWTKEDGGTFSRRMYIQDDGRLVNNHDENIVGDLLVGTLGFNNSSAILQVNSTTQGFLPPRMTEAQRDAISPVGTGLVVYNTDTERLDLHTGAVWESLSTILGSTDNFYVENHERTFSMLTQNNSAFGGAGAFVGTAAANTSTEINGERDFLYTMATGCANDYAASDEIDITDKLDNNWLGISLYYEMSAADDSVKFVLFDDTNDEVLEPNDIRYFKQADNPTRFETAYYIPDGVTSIRYGWQVETCTNTETFQWDDILLTTDPFVHKDIVKTNSLELQGNDARAITANTESIPFDGSGTGWTSGANGSTPTNGNYYTVQNDNSVIQISGNVDWSGSVSTSIVLALNGTQYKRIGGASSEGQHSFQYTSSKGEFSAGDQIAFIPNASGTLVNSAQQHHLTITEQWQAEHVVTAAQSSETETNILSADVSTSTNPVGDLTFSNLVIGQKYFLNFQARLLVTDGESATLTANHNGSVIATLENNIQRSVAGDVITIGTSVFFTAAASTVTFNYIDGGVNSTLFGNNTQEETFAQLTNVTAQFLAAIPNNTVKTLPSVTNISLQSARVQDGSSTTTVTETTGDWLDGVCTNPGAGQYVCSFVSGVFTVAPDCQVTVETAIGARCYLDGGTPATTSLVDIQCVNSGGSAADADFRLLCIGETN